MKRMKFASFEFLTALMFLLIFSFFFAGISFAGGLRSYPCSTCTGGSGGVCPIGPPGASGGDLANSNALSVEQITCFLNSKGSPWADQAADIKAAAVEFNVNPALILAITGQESTWGKSGPSSAPVYDNNPGDVSGGEGLVAHYQQHGLDATGVDGGACDGSACVVIFATMKDGWRAMALNLRETYLDAGDTTIEQIARSYATDPNWSKNLAGWMQEAASCNN